MCKIPAGIFPATPIIMVLVAVLCGTSVGQLPSGQLLPGPRVLIDGTTIYHDANVPKPGYLQSFIDPIFGTKITRISGDPGTNQGGVTVWGADVRHHYSLDQSWNADMSMLILSNKEGGSPSPIILDGETYHFLMAMPISGYYDYRWHPTDPNVLISIGPNQTVRNQVKRYDFAAHSYVLLHTFSEYSTIDWLGKGKLSWDGKMTAFRSDDASNYYAYTYNLETDTKGPVLTLDKAAGEAKPYISASGNYIIVYYSDTDTRIYDANVNYIMKLPYNISHYDYALDANGEDVVVGTYKPSGGGVVITQRLRDGRMTVIAPGYSSHTSATNIRRPGWAYITYMTDWSSYPNYKPYYMEIVAAKMDGTGEVHRLSHIRRFATDYETESHGSASPDGKRVIFASNWNSPTGRPVQTYVIDMRDLRPYKENTDFFDLGLFADWWVQVGICAAPSWCDGCDMNMDSGVSLPDFRVFADHWSP